MIDTPRIYVACLASYNNAILHGVWIDATDSLDDIQSQVTAMLKASPIEEVAEEYAIHDYEGFGDISLSEYCGLRHAHEMACFIEKHNELFASAVLDYCGNDLSEASEMIEDRYMGEYAKLADYAEEIIESSYDVPKGLAFYIDYEAFARDLELGGDVITFETGHEAIHVFLSR